MFGSALLTALLVTLCVIVGVLWSTHRGSAPARLVLPRELRGARLLYAEQLFRSTGRTAITARVDRAYQVASGEIVLLEFKTRDRNRVFPSDVIELSAQLAAVELQTGEIVAHHAYVAVPPRQRDASPPSGAIDGDIRSGRACGTARSDCLGAHDAELRRFGAGVSAVCVRERLREGRPVTVCRRRSPGPQDCPSSRAERSCRQMRLHARTASQGP